MRDKPGWVEPKWRVWRWIGVEGLEHASVQAWRAGAVAVLNLIRSQAERERTIGELEAWLTDACERHAEAEGWPSQQRAHVHAVIGGLAEWLRQETRELEC